MNRIAKNIVTLAATAALAGESAYEHGGGGVGSRMARQDRLRQDAAPVEGDDSRRAGAAA